MRRCGAVVAGTPDVRLLCTLPYGHEGNHRHHETPLNNEKAHGDARYMSTTGGLFADASDRYHFLGTRLHAFRTCLLTDLRQIADSLGNGDAPFSTQATKAKARLEQLIASFEEQE